METSESQVVLRQLRRITRLVVVMTVCVILITVYAGFAFYRYHVGYSLAEIAFEKKLQSAYRNHNHQRRIELCEGKLKEQPEDFRALWGLADAYYKLGRWQDSIDTYKRVLDLNPGMEERIQPIIEKAEAKLNGELKGEIE